MLDLRYAFRQLVRSPGFAAIALLTLTLGMGANTAFFSVLYGVVLREPPYPEAERLVTIHNVSGGGIANGGRLSRAEVRDYAERQRAFQGVAAGDLGRMTLTSAGAVGPAERVKVSRVTANLFAILGVAPARGRVLTARDDRGGMVAVVSHELWQSRFGGVEDILERTIRLNGVEYAIVGIMPAGFAYPERDMGAWLPLDLGPRDGASDRGDHYLGGLARLAPGIGMQAARLDLQRIARALQHDAPAAYPADARWTIGAESLRHTHFGRMIVPLSLLMAAASFVLLIACVNVGIMSLLRALARRREISIRLALGATRHDLIRQLFAEAAVLCVLGAAGGFLLASVGLDLLKAFAPGDIPRLDEAAIDLPAFLFTTAVLLVVTLLVGLAPAFAALRVNGFEDRIPSGRSSDGRTTVRLRDALTVTQIGLAASLLVCAGLTSRSLQALVRVDLGFATEHRFAFKTNLTPGDYPDAARVEGFYEQLTTRLESLPGVASIGAISYLPLSGEGQAVDAAPVSTPVTGPGADLTVGWGIVRGRYFETMGVTLLEGRLFSSEDRPSSPLVAIVDDALARGLWSDEAAALGQKIRLGSGPQAQIRTVVGVVRRVSHLGPGRDSLPMAYAPQSQVYQRGMYTVIRTTAAPQTIAADARAALASVDSSVPMYFDETLDARHDAAVALPRFTAGLVSAFSTLALVLAGVGIFGVTGYAVAQRTREFGIRFALGAQRVHVGRLVLGRVGVLAGLGLAIGTALGLGLGSLMSGILFGVQPDDPFTLTVTLGAIALTAVLASIAPLRRAVLVNPAETLRAD